MKEESKRIQEILEKIGRKFGFKTACDPKGDSRIYFPDEKIQVGRLDVVWFVDIPQFGRAYVAAFEIDARPYSQKKIKGDLFNLRFSRASICAYVAPFKYLKENLDEVPRESRTWYKEEKPRKLAEFYAERLGIAIRVLDFEDVREIATNLGTA